MRQHPLIIGGGPAGSAAAITLAQAGYQPTILERTVGPTDKVCGDFLSADTIQLARSLGIDPTTLGAAPIHLVRLIHGERTAEAGLPFPAMGLSRRLLDAALLRQAEHAGALLQAGRTVRRLIQDGSNWCVETAGHGTLHAKTVFSATGKHDVRNIPRQHTKRDAVGMKMYFRLAPEAAKALDGAVELTLFPGGYVGMQPVEDGHAVVCIAVRQHAFQAYGANWSGLVAEIEHRSRRFAMLLSGARALLPRPLAVAGIPYGYRAPPSSAEGLYRLGDQAAVIPSLTGDGMAIALYSGAAAARAWLAGEAATTYHDVMTRTLAPQMRLAGLLHHACISGSVQSAAARIAGLFPALLCQAASRTRIRAPHLIGQT